MHNSWRHTRAMSHYVINWDVAKAVVVQKCPTYKIVQKQVVMTNSLLHYILH